MVVTTVCALNSDRARGTAAVPMACRMGRSG
jgi:hypothetical protein